MTVYIHLFLGMTGIDIHLFLGMTGINNRQFHVLQIRIRNMLDDDDAPIFFFLFCFVLFLSGGFQFSVSQCLLQMCSLRTC